MSSANPVLSIIIVTHNSKGMIDICLEHLKAATVNLGCEVFLIDNRSTDGTPSQVRQKYPNVRVVPNADNIGFAAACNQGSALSRGKYLLFLNPDVAVDSDSLDALVNLFEGTNNIGLATGRLRFPDGRFQSNCRDFPTVNNLIYSRGSAIKQLLGAVLPKTEKLYTKPDYDQVCLVPAVSATMVMTHRSRFDRCRGFDDRFFLYMEDTDLSLRMQQEGFVNLFVPLAGGVHHWSAGSNASRLRRSWYHHKSVWRYARKHLRGEPAIWLLPPMLLANYLLSCMLPEYRGRNES